MSDSKMHSPRLVREVHGEVAVWTDPELRDKHGMIIAFSERTGGVSRAPYASLNLAAHVGDDPVAVDANRFRLLDALGIAGDTARLTMSEQVHGAHTQLVEDGHVGRGASAHVNTLPPISATDALVTDRPRVPLLMCFADCVPVILVAPGRAVAVVHAGWRGALAGIVGLTVTEMAEHYRVPAEGVIAYVGPHIGACCYPVDDTLMSRFVGVFGDVIQSSSGGLDLSAVVRQDLLGAGVPDASIVDPGLCTAHHTDLFYSYRAESGNTGRHGALAYILPGF